jgi:hypothetical protein
MEWSIVSITHHIRKLWCYESVGGFQLQQLRENVYLIHTLGRKTKILLQGWVVALSKFLKVYVGELAWLAKPT